jgi:hypothetical protein
VAALGTPFEPILTLDQTREVDGYNEVKLHSTSQVINEGRQRTNLEILQHEFARFLFLWIFEDNFSWQLHTGDFLNG